MRWFVWIFLGALIVLHHDVWWWNSTRPLAFGFIPVGLTYHATISLAAGLLWWLAVTYCWPRDVDDLDEELNEPREGAA